LRAIEPGELHSLQTRRERLDLVRPVENQRLRDNDQRREFLIATGDAVLQDCQHLDGLAQAHVVSQATAEAELLQKLQPAESVPLIGAERSLETSRLGGRDPS